MSDIHEPTMIGLSENTKQKLGELQENNFFNQGIDIYRLAIGLAIARGGATPNAPQKATIYSVATLDPNREIYNTIKVLDLAKGNSIYRTAESLAEWGVVELYELMKTGRLDLLDLFEKD
jgi:hypothetical protein